MSKKKNTLFYKLRNKAEYESYHFEMEKSSLRIKFIIFIITILACACFFTFHINQQTKETTLYNIAPGYVWPSQNVIADFTFPIFKDEIEYQNQIDSVSKQALQVFFYNLVAEKTSKEILDSLTEKTISRLNAKISEELTSDIPVSAKSDFFEPVGNITTKELKLLQKQISRFITEIYLKGFINVQRQVISSKEIAARVDNHSEVLYSSINLVDSNLFIEKANSFIKVNLSKELHPIAISLVSKLMIPNLLYSPELTQQYKELASKSISRTEGIVRKGEIIVSKGQKVTDLILLKLISYQRSEYLESAPKYSISIFLGSIGHSFVIYSILLFYLYFIRRKIFHNNFLFGILSVLLIITAFLSWLSIQIPSKLPIEYFVFLPALSMLAAIVFDSRTAFYATITMALMVAGIRGNDYDAGTAMLLAGTIAAYTVRDIQSRTQIFKSMFFIMIGFTIPIISFGMERSADFSQTLMRLLIALLNSAISPLITFGLLFLLERFSNITTDLKLQEYNNLNHPLLVKLNEYAPGTYQHTLSLAILAEKCAIAIGANALLAKVGSYFHDIGKISKPEYFIENQIDAESKHDRLSPKKSVEAIRSHINEGVKLANEYKIPKRISDFIPMHHGTSLIKHFYAKALEEANGRTVNESDFRYPGPKPNSKETSIAMICDSAEAISRLVKDKDQLAIAVEKLIQDKLLDGQFDNSNLTFKDLYVIRETCIKNLIGVSHQRVEYKEIPQNNNDTKIK